MASGPHTFVNVVVFTPTRFQGQRITVVALRGPVNAPPLMAGRKTRIAAEFNQTTVFLYDAPALGKPRQLECYGRTGRPGYWWEDVGIDVGAIVATTHYLFSDIERAPQYGQTPEQRDQQQTAQFFLPMLNTNIAVQYNHYRQVAAMSVPNAKEMVKIEQKKVKLSDVMKSQPQLKIVPDIEELDEKNAECNVVSFGRKAKYVLVDVTKVPDVLKSLEATRLIPDVEGSKEDFVAVVWFVREKDDEREGEPNIGSVACRVFGLGWEEEGSGNAACAVAASLALRKNDDLVEGVGKLSVDSKTGEGKLERKVFGIQQGGSLGRPSTIAVEIDVKVAEDGTRSLASIIVSGRSKASSKGELVGSQG